MASAKEYFKSRQQEMYSSEYRDSLRRHRRKMLLIISGTVVLLILMCFGVYLYNVNRVYTKYNVTSEYEKTDSQSSRYLQMGDKIIRYSMDGISCYDEQYKAVWNQSYEMKNPMVDICESYVAVCDTNGTHFYILGEDGLKGDVETQLPIKRIEVARQGVVAVLLEDGDINRINYYDKAGTLLAENKAPIEKSGYPMDISLSNDGLKMAVSYMTLDGGTIRTKLAFYNFDTVGANEIDHLVSAQEFDGSVVPKVEFVNATTAVAFSDNFVDIFQGSQKPVERAKLKVEQEIESIFYNEAYIGLVLKGTDSHPYTLKVYDLQGKELLSQPLDTTYDQIKLDNELIYIINETRCIIYNLQGKVKFKGDFKEKLIDVLPLSETKLFAVMENKIQDVELK